MDRQAYLMDMRTQGKLKGMKPCFVFLKNNIGRIYNEGQSDFILSSKGGKLYFQKISAILHVLKPKSDFELPISRFQTYSFERKSYAAKLTLFDKHGFFIEIWYQTGLKETYSTEVNIARIIKELEEDYGIKKDDGVINETEGNDKCGEESNKEDRSTEEK